MLPLVEEESCQFTSEGKTAISRLEGLAHLIGSTPLVAIDFEFKGSRRTIFGKYETMNLTGSIKDRMAFHILKNAYASGQLHPGDALAEVSSGNTGISFAAIGNAMKHPVTIFMPNWMSSERVQIIRSYGAQIVSVSREQGGFLGCLQLSQEYASTHERVFLPRQFDNTANVEAHRIGTGPQIWKQLQTLVREPDAFVAGVGTGGTIMGVGSFLRSQRPQVRIHPVEPLESPGLSNRAPQSVHRIQGISDEFVPSIVELKMLDEPIAVSDGDAILAAQALARQLGLAVGISSGCNFLAAVEVQDQLCPEATVVTVFPDDNKKYLSTSLMHDESSKPEYLSPQIKLLEMRCCPLSVASATAA
jgi:cysteine synthase A